MVSKLVHGDNTNCGANDIWTPWIFRHLEEQIEILPAVIVEGGVAHADHFEVERVIILVACADHVRGPLGDLELAKVHAVNLRVYVAAI